MFDVKLAIGSDHAGFAYKEAIKTMLATAPFLRCKVKLLTSDGDFDSHLRSNLASAHHQSGTCRMAPDPRQGVVGADLQVHGIQGLFVCDSSAFPDTVMHNTNFACYMMGEALAHRLRHG